jgi:hypothetical protein
MNNLHPFYTGLGSNLSASSSLPAQAIPDSQKDEKFGRRCMDALESIGIAQLAENQHFTDYRKMLRGDLVYSDYGIDDMPVLNQIRELGDSIGIPTFVKHYDFIGIVVRQFIGEWQRQKDDFKIDTIDEISDNEFLRELNVQAEDFTLQNFEKELQIALLKKGINPEGKEFESEEERQQFIQQLEAEKQRIIPLENQIKVTSKNFKTKAAEWAQNTLQKDREQFDMDLLDSEEMEDYLLTGRYFRHYYVGYDFYKPERWLPEDTFFSKDVDIKYPQKAEYAGRVTRQSPSTILQRYGQYLTPKQVKQLTTRFGDVSHYTQDGRKPFAEKNMNSLLMGDSYTVPFEGYFDYDLALQAQDAFGTPMGEKITENGKETSWLPPFQNGNYATNSYSRRDDFQERTDSLQVTEGYWMSWKRMWFLNYTSKTGYAASEIVTDDLLPEFIEAYGIKKSSRYSLHDLSNRELEDNTMYEFYVPEVWGGVKINAGNSVLGENIYLNVAPLPYQIKGDSDMYEVLLPIGGIISDSVAHKMRPFQVGYNICMNQIWGLLEKEIGMFFLFDINYLPAEYKDYGDIEESIMKLRDFAKDVGIVPMDTSKQGLQGNTPQMNTLMTQEISFDKQMNSRVTLAQFFFSKALEQIGITPTRLGQATTFETATGVQQGVTASHDQTADIFQRMSTARKKCTNLHLAVAQYCQKEYIDKDFVFRSSDNDKAFINLTDPDFPLRRFNVFPINDPKKRRDLEMLKQTLIQTNTLGSDILDYAETFGTGSIAELITIGRKSRNEKNKEIEAQRKHEQEMLDKQLQLQAQEKEAERAHKKDLQDSINETKLRATAMDVQGRLMDKNNSAAEMQQAEQHSDRMLDEFKKEELGVKKSLAENNVQIQQEKLKRMDEELKLKTRNLDLKEKDIEAKRFIAVVNKN